MCDKVWDCPGGTDEANCPRYKCRGQFRCHNSSYCVPPHSICNGINDCPLGDDEFFCHPQLPVCPENCTCVIYSISCLYSNLRIIYKNAPFVHVMIAHSLTSVHIFAKQVLKSVILPLTNLVCWCPSAVVLLITLLEKTRPL